MKRIQLIQLGAGLIGGTTVRQVIQHRDMWRERFGIDLIYAALIGTRGAVVSGDPTGFSGEQLLSALAARTAGTGWQEIAAAGGHDLCDGLAAINQVAVRGTFIVIDTAAGIATLPLAARALELGGGMVFSNKAPLAMPNGDLAGDAIWAATGPGGRVRYETTCGAGLPVISSLQSLLETGDEVIEIMGALSGTLGAIFSDVARGESFSSAVISAKALGYTEPDPRDDLSGLDVARKALILARTMGRSVDLSDIEIESLVPEALRTVSIPTYLDRVSDQDALMGTRAAAAAEAGQTLKYVAQVRLAGPISVGIQSISTGTVLGALQGPENIIAIRTKRYDAYPMNITGPGAGATVTAAGVVADILSLANGPFGT